MMTNSLQEVGQCRVRRLPDLPVAVAEHVQQTVQKIGQPVDHVDVRHAVEDGDPSHLGKTTTIPYDTNNHITLLLFVRL